MGTSAPVKSTATVNAEVTNLVNNATGQLTVAVVLTSERACSSRSVVRQKRRPMAIQLNEVLEK